MQKLQRDIRRNPGTKRMGVWRKEIRREEVEMAVQREREKVEIRVRTFILLD